jgi:hypothetical protein
MRSRFLLSYLAGVALILPAGAQMRMQNRAVQNCQDNIRQRAINQFGTGNVRFDEINTSRSGWVSGMVRVGDGMSSTERRFSCAVNMDSGYVRSSRIEGAPVASNQPGQRYGEAGRDIEAAGMDGCRATIADRLRGQGYWNIRVKQLNRDPDGNRVTGFARADGQDHPESFSFSCSLDPDSGVVRGTSVSRR